MRLPTRLWTLSVCGALLCTTLAVRAESDDLPDNPTPNVPIASYDPAGHRPLTDREEGWKTLPGDFLHDQKEIWTAFPMQLAHGHHWVPVVAVAGVTTGLLYADSHAMPYFRAHQKNLDKVNDVFDAYITTGEVVAIPASLLATGYMRHDRYQVSTALLCADAYADSAIVDLVIKAITRRERPVDVPANTPFQDTFFAGNESPVKGSSFPSGHAAGAFSVATVVARRYSNHKWVPWTVYGFATVVGLSRIADEAHFPSDVFLGGAIGYAVTQYQTLRPR